MNELKRDIFQFLSQLYYELEDHYETYKLNVSSKEYLEDMIVASSSHWGVFHNNLFRQRLKDYDSKETEKYSLLVEYCFDSLEDLGELFKIGKFSMDRFNTYIANLEKKLNIFKDTYEIPSMYSISSQKIVEVDKRGFLNINSN